MVDFVGFVLLLYFLALLPLLAYSLARATDDRSTNQNNSSIETTGSPPTNHPPKQAVSDTNRAGTHNTLSRIDSQLDTARTQVEDACQARKARNYDRALAASQNALDAAEMAQELARDSNSGRLPDIEAELSRIRQLDEALTAERDTYQEVLNHLDTLPERLDAAASQLKSDPETMLAALDDIESNITDVADRASEYEFRQTTRQLEQLRQRCEQLRAQAEKALTNRPPETIPTATRRSLSHDDLRKDRTIGTGGNAEVYHATGATTDGEVELALKEPRMDGTLQTETVERMLEEADVWQKLDNHDHIVTVVDYGSEPLPWIAMEYMDAGHLGERADDIQFEQALWTAIATTRAVRHAHGRGVAHLDLKPANILFRSVEDAWDVPKVADWGLSKHLLEHSKSVEGMSPHYAAPEQFDTEQYGSTDHVTDVYQLGTVFYELFTGRPPFEGQTFEVINKIQSERPVPPSEVADVPAALDEILLTALATEKDDRYEDVLYLRDDLQALQDEL